MVDLYLDNQPFITSNMRAILVDWLVEVQENFELFHETLYLAVKIVDRYLERKEVKKEYLQLVGATAMLVASKFEVRTVSSSVTLEIIKKKQKTMQCFGGGRGVLKYVFVVPTQ